MKIGIGVFIALCLGASLSSAQPQEGLFMPGRSVAEPTTQVVYKDSAEFAKLFKELYAIIGPKNSVMQDAKEYLSRMSRSFAIQGLDSAKADSVALIGLDPEAYHTLYFETYRRQLSAVELKKFLEFVKTPEGKKIVSVFPQLQRVTPEANAYISRTINLNLGPLRQEARMRMEKERPPMERGKVPAPRFAPGEQLQMVPPPPSGTGVPPTPAPLPEPKQ